ncbi:hypothetical protein IA54_021405 [Xanthomonas phaseoli pv. syngonii LMG 9055]|uniref:Uncharacterized protein n=1 Tax=Xanthomonas phaseoli pv. syngonii LMG 9055 TaxID=1437878 RepID=A0A1V9HE55_9XANT|nr:hypothetical protein IA54_021405 [Xanthomonas phaseoli pv. syngonii LMG 9055]
MTWLIHCARCLLRRCLHDPLICNVEFLQVFGQGLLDGLGFVNMRAQYIQVVPGIYVRRKNIAVRLTGNDVLDLG